jgi:redox-sensing transcriptional repressor
MELGYSGDPQRGYHIGQLADSIGELLDASKPVLAAIVGIGNLGRALVAYFSGRCPKLAITAGFDVDPYKVDRVILGCRCYPMTELASVVREQNILVAIVAVPAGEAQSVTDKLAWAGIRGILNFAPVRLKVGPGVYVENVDMTMSLEKVAYFATRGLTTSVDISEEAPQ